MRMGNGEMGPTMPNMTPRGIPEIAPPQYTEQVGPEMVAIPRSDGIEPSNTEPNGNDGETVRVSQTELTTGDERNEGSSGLDAMQGSTDIFHYLISLGARGPGTSDYMLRTLRSLVKFTWLLIGNNISGTFQM